jgi:hypothetical protein
VLELLVVDELLELLTELVELLESDWAAHAVDITSTSRSTLRITYRLFMKSSVFGRSDRNHSGTAEISVALRTLLIVVDPVIFICVLHDQNFHHNT